MSIAFRIKVVSSTGVFPAGLKLELKIQDNTGSQPIQTLPMSSIDAAGLLTFYKETTTKTSFKLVGINVRDSSGTLVDYSTIPNYPALTVTLVDYTDKIQPSILSYGDSGNDSLSMYDTSAPNTLIAIRNVVPLLFAIVVSYKSNGNSPNSLTLTLKDKNGVTLPAISPQQPIDTSNNTAATYSFCVNQVLNHTIGQNASNAWIVDPLEFSIGGQMNTTILDPTTNQLMPTITNYDSSIKFKVRFVEAYTKEAALFTFPIGSYVYASTFYAVNSYKQDGLADFVANNFYPYQTTVDLISFRSDRPLTSNGSKIVIPPVASGVTTMMYLDEFRGTGVDNSLAAGVRPEINYDITRVNNSPYIDYDETTNRLYFNSSAATIEASPLQTFEYTFRVVSATNSDVTQYITFQIAKPLAADHLPVINVPSSINYFENSTAVVQTLIATDADNDAITLSLLGADATKFVLDGNNLKFVSPPNFENPTDSDTNNVYAVTIRASTAKGFTEKLITVTVVNVDEFLTVNLPVEVLFTENLSSTVLNVQEFESPDPDATTPVYLYTLEGADANAFNLVGKVLTFKTTPNFEVPLDADANNVYQLALKISTIAGTISTNPFTVRVVDVAEAPELTIPSVLYFNESKTSNVFNGVIATSNNPLTYTLVGSPDKLLFNTSALNEVPPRLAFLEQPDFEHPKDANGDNLYEITIAATDGTFTVQKNVTVTVTDNNENPCFSVYHRVPTNPDNRTSGASYIHPEGISSYLSLYSHSDATFDYFEMIMFSAVDAGNETITVNIVNNDGNIAVELSTDKLFINPITTFGNFVASRTEPKIFTLDNPQASNGTVSNNTRWFNFNAVENASPNTFTNFSSVVTFALCNVKNITLTGGSDLNKVRLDVGAPYVDSITGVQQDFSWYHIGILGATDFRNPSDFNHDNVYNLEINYLNAEALPNDQVKTAKVNIVIGRNVVQPEILFASFDALDNTTQVGLIETTLPYPHFAITGGVDMSKFDINATTGALFFRSAVSYANPSDRDKNNQYIVVVTVDDGYGLSSSKTLTVNSLPANAPSTANQSDSSYLFIQGALEVSNGTPKLAFEANGFKAIPLMDYKQFEDVKTVTSHLVEKDANAPIYNLQTIDKVTKDITLVKSILPAYGYQRDESLEHYTCETPVLDATTGEITVSLNQSGMFFDVNNIDKSSFLEKIVIGLRVNTTDAFSGTATRGNPLYAHTVIPASTFNQGVRDYTFNLSQFGFTNLANELANGTMLEINAIVAYKLSTSERYSPSFFNKLEYTFEVAVPKVIDSRPDILTSYSLTSTLGLMKGYADEVIKVRPQTDGWKTRRGYFIMAFYTGTPEWRPQIIGSSNHPMWQGYQGLNSMQFDSGNFVTDRNAPLNVSWDGSNISENDFDFTLIDYSVPNASLSVTDVKFEDLTGTKFVVNRPVDYQFRVNPTTGQKYPLSPAIAGTQVVSGTANCAHVEGLFNSHLTNVNPSSTDVVSSVLDVYATPTKVYLVSYEYNVDDCLAQFNKIPANLIVEFVKPNATAFVFLQKVNYTNYVSFDTLAAKKLSASEPYISMSQTSLAKYMPNVRSPVTTGIKFYPYVANPFTVTKLAPLYQVDFTVAPLTEAPGVSFAAYDSALFSSYSTKTVTSSDLITSISIKQVALATMNHVNAGDYHSLYGSVANFVSKFEDIGVTVDFDELALLNWYEANNQTLVDISLNTAVNYKFNIVGRVKRVDDTETPYYFKKTIELDPNSSDMQIIKSSASNNRSATNIAKGSVGYPMPPYSSSNVYAMSRTSVKKFSAFDKVSISAFSQRLNYSTNELEANALIGITRRRQSPNGMFEALFALAHYKVTAPYIGFATTAVSTSQVVSTMEIGSLPYDYSTNTMKVASWNTYSDRFKSNLTGYGASVTEARADSDIRVEYLPEMTDAIRSNPNFSSHETPNYYLISAKLGLTSANSSNTRKTCYDFVLVAHYRSTDTFKVAFYWGDAVNPTTSDTQQLVSSTIFREGSYQTAGVDSIGLQILVTSIGVNTDRNTVTTKLNTITVEATNGHPVFNGSLESSTRSTPVQPVLFFPSSFTSADLEVTTVVLSDSYSNDPFALNDVIHIVSTTNTTYSTSYSFMFGDRVRSSTASEEEDANGNVNDAQTRIEPLDETELAGSFDPAAEGSHLNSPIGNGSFIVNKSKKPIYRTFNEVVEGKIVTDAYVFTANETVDVLDSLKNDGNYSNIGEQTMLQIRRVNGLNAQGKRAIYQRNHNSLSYSTGDGSVSATYNTDPAMIYRNDFLEAIFDSDLSRAVCLVDDQANGVLAYTGDDYIISTDGFSSNSYNQHAPPFIENVYSGRIMRGYCDMSTFKINGLSGSVHYVRVASSSEGVVSVFHDEITVIGGGNLLPTIN